MFTSATLHGGRILAVGSLHQDDTQALYDDVVVRPQNDEVFRATFD